jgi:hypothetical protein
MSVCCECCVLSSTRLCEGRFPVQRSPTGCGVTECDSEAGQQGGPGPLGAVAPWKNNYWPGKTVTINRVLFVDYFKL